MSSQTHSVVEGGAVEGGAVEGGSARLQCALAIALVLVPAALGGAGAASSALAEDARGWVVDTDQSVFALLTQKGGFLAGRAHDHLIVATRFEATLAWSGGESATAFSAEIRARDLDADPDGPRRRLAPRLVELGLHAGLLPPLSQKQRAQIRETMLGPKQLDAERFPTISVSLVDVRTEVARSGDVELSHRGTISFTAHGRSVALDFRARLEPSEESLTVEAFAPLRFTQIGIEPYSAFLGAVKNLDDTTLYLRLVARRATGSSLIPAATPSKALHSHLIYVSVAPWYARLSKLRRRAYE